MQNKLLIPISEFEKLLLEKIISPPLAHDYMKIFCFHYYGTYTYQEGISKRDTKRTLFHLNTLSHFSLDNNYLRLTSRQINIIMTTLWPKVV